MLVVKKQPPNYAEIEKAFPIVSQKKGIVYTFGEAIFNPDDGPLDEPLLYHESTHSLQQDEMGPHAWWDKYLSDPEFRLDQELEAYQNQYRKYCEQVKDRNRRASYLFRIANDLSSPQYGSIISYSEARKLISTRS